MLPNETLSSTLARLVKDRPISRDGFEITQVKITLEASNALKEASERAGTRQLMYLERMLK